VIAVRSLLLHHHYRTLTVGIKGYIDTTFLVVDVLPPTEEVAYDVGQNHEQGHANNASPVKFFN